MGERDEREAAADIESNVLSFVIKTQTILQKAKERFSLPSQHTTEQLNYNFKHSYLVELGNSV